MKILKFALIFPLCALSACDTGPKFAELCNQHPEICQEFEEDTWCKRERISVGFANLNNKLESNDSHKYEQLIAYENYEKCMTHASKIEHIKLKVKKTLRVNNMLKAREKIKEISTQTLNSEHPDLLYFHWSRYLNERALNKFLTMEGNEILARPNRQVNLATYYAKRDPNKTLRILYYALELYPAGAAIDVEIFKSIASIFSDKKEHKQAYIWSKVLQIYAPEDINVNNEILKDYVIKHNLNRSFLDKVAESTLSKIEDGSFVSPHV